MKAYLLVLLTTSLLGTVTIGIIPENFVMQNVHHDTPSRDELNQQLDEKLNTGEEALANLTTQLDQFEVLMETGFPVSTGNDDEGQETGTGNTSEQDETEAEDVGDEVVELHQFPVYVKPEEKYTKGEIDEDEMTGRHYTGTVSDYLADDVSGICASRAHPGIMYYLNDNSEDEAYVYAVNIEENCKMVSRIELTVTKDEWEDMACGPCTPNSETDFCIYIIDDHDGDTGEAEIIYKIREPDVLVENIIHTVQDDEIIKFNSNLDSIHTIMVHPNGRIFVMDRTYSYYPLYEVIDGEVVKLFNVGLWTYYKGPVAADISPSGDGWLFKMLDRVYYFYVKDLDNMEDVMSSSSNREKMPYKEEGYGTSVAWTLGMGSFVTVSEGTNEPWYRYYRTA